METDPNLVIASIAVIVAIGGTIITGLQTRESNKLTRKSNELTSKEFAAKLRPWVKIEGVEPVQAIYADKHVENWQKALEHIQDKPVKIRLEGSFTNIGSVPCYSVSRLVKDNVEFGRDIVLTDVMKNNKQILIMPNETIRKSMEISFEEWINKERIPIFIGLGIIFTINDNLEGRMDRIYQFFQGRSLILDDWYEEQIRNE